MGKWRITSEDSEVSKIVIAPGPEFPRKEMAAFVREYEYGDYTIEDIAEGD